MSSLDQELGTVLEAVVHDHQGRDARAWGQVRTFSPWRNDTDKAAVSLFEGYLRPLAELPEIASRLPIDARVTAAARVGFGKIRMAGREAAPFDVRYTGWYRPESSMLASAVIDTSGTRATPGWADASGIPAVGERKAGGRIVHGMPDIHGADRGRFAGKGTMVVGSGDSATYCTPAQKQAPDIAAE